VVAQPESGAPQTNHVVADVTLDPLPAVQGLIDATNQVDLASRQDPRLFRHLERARTAFAAGRTQEAVNALRSFVREVDSHPRGRGRGEAGLAEDDAAALIARAMQIIGCV
jgi:hypothetical protein